MDPINQAIESLEKKRISKNPKNQNTKDLSRQYECEICRDNEFIIDDKNTAHPCKCREIKAIRRLIKSSGLSKAQQNITFENLDPNLSNSDMYWLCKDYLDNFDDIFNQETESKGIALMGSVGTGKTTLLLAVVNGLLQRKWPALFVNTSELFAELLAAQWGESNESLEAKIHRISTAKVVIFDDVGKEKPSERVQIQYYRIINYRYSHRLPTCFTSNLTFPELEEKIGDANMSRLFALTAGRQMQIETEDYRLSGF